MASARSPHPLGDDADTIDACAFCGIDDFDDGAIWYQLVEVPKVLVEERCEYVLQAITSSDA